MSLARAHQHVNGSDWPKDPSDPRCPTCGEPVSATASYCLHCEADLPGADVEQAAAATAAERAGPTVGAETADPGMPTSEQPVERSGWLDPDGVFDNVSTATVGVVGGFLDGFVLFLLALWAFPKPVQSSWGLAVGIVGWLLATGWIGWTRTVFGALRKAAYSFAVLVALAPLAVAVALGDPAAIVFGIVVWPVAGIVAGVGWLAGRGSLDDGG